MKSIAAARRVKVSADGRGVVSHAGMGLLRGGRSDRVIGAGHGRVG